MTQRHNNAGLRITKSWHFVIQRKLADLFPISIIYWRLLLRKRSGGGGSGDNGDGGVGSDGVGGNGNADCSTSSNGGGGGVCVII